MIKGSEVLWLYIVPALVGAGIGMLLVHQLMTLAVMVLLGNG